MAVLDFDAKRNRYAVYTGSSDAPLTDPLDNLPNVKWHASLPYIGTDARRIVTTDLNPRNWTDKGASPKRLVAHGKNFRPLVFGSVTIGGRRIPIMGNFLVKVQATVISMFVYTDTTHVLLDWDIRLTQPISTQALNGRFEIYVCNMGLSAGNVPINPPSFDGVEITPSRFRAGTYDTNDQHFAYDADGPVLFYTGQSMDVDRTVNALGIRHAVAGYNVTLDSTSTFSAPVVRSVAK